MMHYNSDVEYFKSLKKSRNAHFKLVSKNECYRYKKELIS